MTPLELAATLVVLAAVFRYLNDTLLGLPAAVGVTALAASVAVGLAGAADPWLADRVRAVVGQVDIGQAVLHGMLGFMWQAVAGLLIGSLARERAMSPATARHFDAVWELIDETLNAVLFVLLGLAVLTPGLTARNLLAGLLAVPLVLAARWASVGLPLALLRGRLPERCGVRLLTWGGLRGGVAVALALSIPAGPGGGPNRERERVLALTYTFVVFSVLVQGLTVGPLARRWAGSGCGTAPAPAA